MRPAPRPHPAQIDGADVVYWTPIDARHRHTGACRHWKGENLQPPATGLAICRYANTTDCFYLFRCDAEWNCVTDTMHESVAEAMRQAEFEYEGVTATW